jgi:hypothetical protein
MLGEHLGVTRVGYAGLEGGEYASSVTSTRVGCAARRTALSGFGVGPGEGIPARRNGCQNDVASDPRFTEAERAALSVRSPRSSA